MAQQTINNGGSGLTTRTKINENFTEVYAAKFDVGTSEIFTAATVKKQFQTLVGPDANDKPIEIVNIGYTGHGATDDIHENTTGIVRINGRLQFVRNMRWNQSSAKWETPIQTASAYGSSLMELGGEAVILHATPSGVDFSDVPHEILMASANGTDGETNNRVTSGYFTQTKAPLFARFNSTAYSPSGTNNCWNDVTGAHPLLWLSTAEAKNSDNELARMEANANSSSAWGAAYFAKSRGTLQGRTIAVTGETTGRLGWKLYDGDEYHITAAIEGASEGTMANNQVGQALVFKTSPDTTANLAERMRITKDGYIVLTGLPTASAGLPSGAIWSDSGTLKVA